MSDYNLDHIAETLRSIEEKIDALFVHFELEFIRCNDAIFHDYRAINYYGLECPKCSKRYDPGFIVRKKINVST